MRPQLFFCTLALAAATGAPAQSYSNAVTALNPVAYWPLNETVQPPAAYIATNYGTLGAKANAYYNNPYYYFPNGAMTLFTGPVAGATSDGNAAAQFNGGANSDDNSGYVLIPQVSQNLSFGVPFSAEVWVMPGGGDPNDSSGSSFSSTEWAGLIKKGGGGAYYTENGDANGNTYGWTISLAGINTLGYPVGWYGGTPYTGPIQLQTNACWVVDFYNGGNGNSPSLEFDVPFLEPTPVWFHLALTFDGTNANFYTNGVLAATTVPGLPQSTNQVFAPNQGPITSPSGAYQFATANGVGYAPDTINPICLGNLNESYSIVGQGFPAPNAIGFNCQVFNGAMDEAAIYTNALSGTAVAKHFADATAANTTLYTNDVLSAHPIVYLRFDEPAYVEPDPSTFPVANCYGSLGAAADGAYEPGVIVGIPGAPVAGFGASSVAIQVNGLDTAVDIGGGGGLSGSALDPQGHQAFSVAAWFRANPADCYGRFQTILGRGDHAWRFSIDNGGAIHWNPGNNPELTTAQNFNDGAWHQLVGVSDGTNATLYIDGQLNQSGSGVGTLGGSVDDLLLGGAPDYINDEASGSQRYFAGQLAQVAFFGTNLSSAQVQSLFFAANLPPSITQQPQRTTIAQGQGGSLSVSASGSPTLTYQWYSGTPGSAAALGNGTDAAGSTLSGATASTLGFANTQPGDGTNFFVVVGNAYGSATSSVVAVTVTALPSIVAQPTPASTTVYAGNQVSFNVGAIGSPPLSYQWYRGTSAIAGASGTNYSFAALAGTNAYSVVVSNTHGAVTSSVATVTGVRFVAPASGVFTVNYSVGPGSANPYYGQGAYSEDTNNNYWNLVPSGSGAVSAAALSSASNSTLVSLSLVFGFNNTGLPNAADPNGTPGYLVATEDAVNGGSPGIGTSAAPEGQITLKDVPPGSYSLYLYAANFDGNRGSIFTVDPSNGGTADGGTNGTVNAQSDHSGTPVTFVEGDNYVFFHDVTPNAAGTITITYIPNPAGQLTGEAPFDGLQLALHLINITPATGGNVTISWSGGSLQSATSVSGPYTTVNATSPMTIPASGSAQFFRVF